MPKQVSLQTVSIQLFCDDLGIELKHAQCHFINRESSSYLQMPQGAPHLDSTKLILATEGLSAV